MQIENTKTGYFTVTTRGTRHHHTSFELAAFAAYHQNRERVIEVERVLVNGTVQLRERDVTTRAVDFLSCLETA